LRTGANKIWTMTQTLLRLHGTSVNKRKITGLADFVVARLLPWLFLPVATLSQLGCSTNPAVGNGSIVTSTNVSAPEDIGNQFGTIGVTPVRSASREKLVDSAGMARGPLDGAMTAGGTGFKAGLATGYVLVPIGMAMCVVPSPACLVGLGVLAAGTAAPIVGGVSGAIGGVLLAESEETIRKSEAAVGKAAATERPREIISDHIVQTITRHGANAFRVSAPSVPLPAVERVNSLLDTELVGVSLAPGAKRAADINPPFRLSMIMQSRVRRRHDGVELAARSVSYQSKERSLAQWADNDARLFRAELRAASIRMAEEMVDVLVLLYPESVEPLLPPDGAQVPALKPTLGWEPLPVQENEPAGGGGTSSPIQATEYELRVSYGSEIVYQRAGLHEVNHEIGESLLSCRDLQWRVRARFELAGKVRVSQWSPIRSFKTPCYGEPSTWAKSG